MTTQEAKIQAIRAAFTKGTILVVAIYIVIILIDFFWHPAYKGWMVALFTICGVLVGMAGGFIMAFRIRFSTVMRRRTDGEMIEEIQNQPPKTKPTQSRNFGLDDEE